jgi:homocysteine S-methyltransferase
MGHRLQVVLLDPALSTACPEHLLDPVLWSAVLLTYPQGIEVIQQVHDMHIQHGAQIITTASYQASLQRFVQYGLDDVQAERAIREAVAVAKRARGGRFMVKVAASVGPYAAFLADGSEYTGDYQGVGSEVLSQFHAEKIGLLLMEEPDMLALETLPNLLEAKVLTELLCERFPNACAWMSACCRDEEKLVRRCAQIGNLCFDRHQERNLGTLWKLRINASKYLQSE